jgi:hypothetical protein
VQTHSHAPDEATAGDGERALRDARIYPSQKDKFLKILPPWKDNLVKIFPAWQWLLV